MSVEAREVTRNTWPGKTAILLSFLNKPNTSGSFMHILRFSLPTSINFLVLRLKRSSRCGTFTVMLTPELNSRILSADIGRHRLT